MSNRVMVTGMGAICPIGNRAKTAYQAAVRGECGIEKATYFDSNLTGIHVAGQVKDLESVLPVNKREARRLDRFTQLAITAAFEAWEQSGMEKANDDDKERVGLILGSGMGGLETICEQDRLLVKEGPLSVSPFFIPKSIINVAAGTIAIKLGLHGPCYGIVTACSSGADAIGQAYYAIKEGRLDAVLTGGSEAVLTDLAVQGFKQMQALSESDDPTRASIPFDHNRQGFVMGEGAAFLVLESEASAQKRNASVYGEVIGFGQTCDAFHVTAPHKDGTYAKKAMQNALFEAKIDAENIGYINAHGTGTPLNDVIETKAIKQCFKEHAAQLMVSSTKSMTAHMLGAAGAMESIFTMLALSEGFAPPTIGLVDEDPDCDLDYVKHKAKPLHATYAMSNAFGFGGHNSVLVFKKGD